MIMLAVAPHRWSAVEVRALPEDPGRRVECVDGALFVTPSPRLPQQLAVALLLRTLDGFVRANELGTVVIAPADLELDPFTLVQPDLFVLPLVNGRLPATVEAAGRPLLLVEVLSPTTAHMDRVLKRARYQRAGVEYWIVDLDARLVERWSPDVARPDICTEELLWSVAGASSPLALPLRPFFAEVLGEVPPAK